MNLLEKVTHDILEQYGPFNLGRLTLVFPTRRAGMMITELLRKSLEKQNIRRPMLAPEITTLSELFDSLSSLGREDDIRLVATLYQIYEEITNQSPPLKGGGGDSLSFETFFPWGRRLISDFSNIDKGYPDVEPLSFLKHTASAHELETLKLEDDVRERLQDLIQDTVLSDLPDDSVHASYERIWQLLPELYTRFRDALGDRTYEGARMKDVLLNWDSERVQQRFRGRHFIFAGFNYIVPAERELMLRLQQAGQATFYWDYPAAFACNPKAFKWVRRNAEQIIRSNAFPVEPWHPREVELITSDSVNAQAGFVHQWLLDHHHPGDRTAIVLCDETLLQDVIAALPEDDGTGRFARINISKGFPLSHTPVFAAMMAYLSDPRNERQPSETYAAVLDRLIDALPKPAEPAKNTDTTENTDALAPETEPVDWTTLLAREAYYQLLLALNRFRLLLEDPNLLPLRSLASLRHLLKRYVQSISLPFHGEPMTDIQVVGVLETRSLDFDNILLLNVEEGIVPQVKEEESFIPFFLRKAYGMPTVEEATDVYAYNFFRLLRRPKQLTVCYTGSENRTNRKSPSRFIIQMMASSDFILQKRILTASADVSEELAPAATPVALPNLLSTLTVDPAGYLCRRDDGKRFTLSPSAISAYLTCPRQFYYSNIMKVDEGINTGASLTRAEVGSFVHKAIQLTYEHLAGSLPITRQHPLTLTPELLASVDDACLNDILDLTYLAMNQEVLERHGIQDFYHREAHEIENAFILTAVRRVLSADARLAAEGKLTLLEQESFATFTLDFPDEHFKIQVGGRIDRVDEISSQSTDSDEQKRTRIVDYKTGHVDTKQLQMPPVSDLDDSYETLFPLNTKPGYWLQTLIYSHAWKEKMSYGFSRSFEALAEIRTVNCQLSTIYFPRDTGPVCYPVHAEQPQTFSDAFRRLVTTILTDTALPLAPEGKCDPFCAFYELCNRPKPQEY